MLPRFRCTPILSALAVLLLASGAQAISVLPENGTVTEFDVASQTLSFEYDPFSIYEIVHEDAELFQHESSFPGCLPVEGTFYAFLIPNFHDPLPKKTVDVTMAGSNPSAAELPHVLLVIGADFPYGSSGLSWPDLVWGSRISRNADPELVTEAWEMFPNPDGELVKIFVPSDFELTSIRIETQSIPEPATAALMVAGLFGLSLAGRRRS
jgi:hypothetical protein